MIYLPRCCSVGAVSDGMVTTITIPDTPALDMPVNLFMGGQRVSSRDLTINGKKITISGDFSQLNFDVDYFVSVIDEERAADIKVVSDIQKQLDQIKKGSIYQSTVLVTPKSDFDISEIGVDFSKINDTYTSHDISDEEFDFHNAKKDLMLSLRKNSGGTKEEQDILFAMADSFAKTIGAKVFNSRTIGCPTLGEFRQVQREAVYNGLPFMQANREKYPARHIYKAYRSKNNALRGLRFLRAYLQSMLPDSHKIAQMWQDKSLKYTQGMAEEKRDGFFLTSRVRITIFIDKAVAIKGIEMESIYKVHKYLQSIAPARVVIDLVVSFSEALSCISKSAIAIASIVRDGSDLKYGYL